MLEIVGCGDLHLEAHYNILPDPVTPLLRVIKQVNSYALLNGIKYVFFFGDMFDNPTPNKKTIISFLDSLDDRLEYFALMGNHEYNQKDIDEENTDDNAYQLLEYLSGKGSMPNVHYYTQPTKVKIENKIINFLPFPYTEVDDNVDLNVGHFDIQGYHYDNGREIEEGAKVNTKKVLCGHIHTTQMPVYCGSMVQSDFGEEPKKYFLHIKIGNKLKTQLVPVALPFELITLSIEDEKDFSILKKYKDEKYRLRLLIKNNVEVPSDLNTLYPNIVKTEGYKNKKEKLNLEKNNLVIETKIGSWKENKALKTFLKSEGLSKKQIKKCKKILSKLKN